MKTLIAVSAFASLSVLAFTASANAQGAVAPGTEFPAAPMSKSGFSLSAPSQPMAAAPPPGPVVAAAPEPAAPKKRRKRRK